MECAYCHNIQTTFSKGTHKQITGTLGFFINTKNHKHYFLKCCLLKYGLNEISQDNAFNDRVLEFMKIKNHKYILANECVPLIVYELKLKSIEVFENLYIDRIQTSITINRNITLQEIPEIYEFINYNKYESFMLKSQTPLTHNNILNTIICPDVQRVYLIHDAVAIVSNENIYKIGRTSQQDLSRFKNYTKGYKLLFLTICNDCINVEKKIIYIFKSKYIHRIDRGKEYFQGCCIQMIKDIITIVYC